MKKLLSLALVLVLIMALIPAAHADVADTFLEAAIAVANENDAIPGLYEYQRVGNLCMINYHSKDTDTCYTTALKTKAYLPVWKLVVDAFAEECKNVSEGLATFAPDVVLVYNIISETEPRTLYATFVGDQVIYDAARGISVLNPEAE